MHPLFTQATDDVKCVMTTGFHFIFRVHFNIPAKELNIRTSFHWKLLLLLLLLLSLLLLQLNTVRKRNNKGNNKGTILLTTQESSCETFDIWLMSSLTAEARDTKISAL